MSYTKPADFDSYWKSTLEELARYPARPEVDLIPIRCTDFADMYGVRLTSAGPYRIFAYLSIPKGRGPFPAIYYTPRYQSVHEVIPQGTANLQRSRFITFYLAARGQRNSDQPFAAMFPGLLTDRIDDPQWYPFRGIVADCVRGLEYLLTRPELDKSRIVVHGNDMALITAALCQQASHVVCTPALFYETVEMASRTNGYPLEEVNDYLRLHKGKEEAVQRTLSYLDLRWFAPRVSARTLVMAGPSGSAMDGKALELLTSAIAGKVTVHDSEQSSYKDGLYIEQWIASQLGYKDAIVPEHWQ